MQSVLDIMISDRSNEQLDNIILKDQNYIQASKQTNEALEALEKTLDAKQQHLLDDYIASYNATSALHTQSAYRLGLADMLSLLRDLLL